jgi:MOSC domain-containing protein YiiM
VDSASDTSETPTVVAVARDDAHRFSKPVRDEIVLIAGHGVEGDAHAGPKMRHRSRVKGADTPPNLRQVHLIQRELFDELAVEGHEVAPGELGENVTTAGVDLLALPRGTRIRLGDSAEVELTGLRTPWVQIDRFQSGLMKRLIRRDGSGATHRRAGVMAVVVDGGTVRAGDALTVTLPDGPREPLDVV